MKPARNIPLLIAFLAYCVLIVAYWNKWLYSIGPDFLSQLSIAKKYAAGNFHEAVNGWWSPLFNWLLAVFLKLGLNDFTAFRCINVLFGAGIIFLTDQFIRSFIDKTSLLLITFIPVITFFVLSCDSTDVPTIFIFMLFTQVLMKLVDHPDHKTAYLLGITAAFGYFAKTYNLYFFGMILTFLFLSALIRSKFRLQKNVTASALAIIIFVAVSSLWAVAIYNKYGHFSFSTRGRFTSSEVNQNEMVMPMAYRGFTAPPDASSISAWDDPVIYLETNARQVPLISDVPGFLQGTVIRNIGGFFKNHISLYQLILLALLSPFLISSYKKKLLWPFLITILFPTGFFIFHNEDRFYWPVLIMLMAGITIGFETVFEKISATNFFRIAGMLLIAVMFSYRPLMRLHKEADPSFIKFYDALHDNKAIEFLQSRRFASLNHRWDYGLYATYSIGGTYYGESKPGWNAEQLQQELLNYDIDCLLVFGEPTIELPKAESIISISNIDLKIYVFK